MATRLCDVSVEMVRVKEEPDWAYSPDEVEAPDASFTEYDPEMQQTVCIKSEPCSDGEGESAQPCADQEGDQLDLRPAAALQVKDEPSVPDGTHPCIKAEPCVDPCQQTPCADSSIKAEPCSDPGVEEPSADQENQVIMRPVFSVHSAQPGMIYLFNASNQTLIEAKPVEKHARRVNDEKPFHCDICKKPFKRKRHMETHKLSHQVNTKTRAKDKPFYCAICKKQFIQLLKFTDHLQIHATAIPYTCDMCKKQFKRHGDLTRHIEAHRDRPHSCDVCQDRFRFKVELMRHKLTHVCVNPMCGVCDEHTMFSPSTHKRINILRR